MVGPTKFIQGPLFRLAAGASVEFSGHHSRENGALENPSVFAEPQVFFSSAKPNVYAGIKQEESGRQGTHFLS